MSNKKEPVLLNMTGEQFKKLIEQRDENGVVDTLQEVLAMFEGIDDGETIAQYVQRMISSSETIQDTVEKSIDEMSAEDKDIEDLFPN